MPHAWHRQLLSSPGSMQIANEGVRSRPPLWRWTIGHVDRTHFVPTEIFWHPSALRKFWISPTSIPHLRFAFFARFARFGARLADTTFAFVWRLRRCARLSPGFFGSASCDSLSSPSSVSS